MKETISDEGAQIKEQGAGRQSDCKEQEDEEESWRATETGNKYR